MKSLNFGASLAPRMVFAASNSQFSRVGRSKCSSFSGGKRVGWIISVSVFFFGNGSFPLENSFQFSVVSRRGVFAGVFPAETSPVSHGSVLEKQVWCFCWGVSLRNRTYRIWN